MRALFETAIIKIPATLPDETQHFSSDSFFPAFFIGHYTRRGREDSKTEPIENLGDFVPLDIISPPWLTNTFNSANYRLVACVLQINPDNPLQVILIDSEIFNVALFLQNLNNTSFHF